MSWTNADGRVQGSITWVCQEHPNAVAVLCSGAISTPESLQAAVFKCAACGRELPPLLAARA